MINSIFKISPELFNMEKLDTNITPESPYPSKKSVLSKALSYAYSFYKDKDPENPLFEIPKDTNKVAPIPTITPALLQSIWIDFDSSDSETDEPITIHNSGYRIEDYNYGYNNYGHNKYDSSTEEEKSIDDGYHSDCSSNTYDSDYSYNNDTIAHINDSATWRNLKH
jgi:hypothetical protein